MGLRNCLVITSDEKRSDEKRGKGSTARVGVDGITFGVAFWKLGARSRALPVDSTEQLKHMSVLGFGLYFGAVVSQGRFFSFIPLCCFYCCWSYYYLLKYL